MGANFERAFERRPEAYEAWTELNGAIKAGMDLRRYELVTLASAVRLRSITDVVLAAAARCFFSKTLDALGIRADAGLRELDPELRDVLVVGRPIADA